jgi:ABC-2 type transport system permease protein
MTATPSSSALRESPKREADWGQTNPLPPRPPSGGFGVSALTALYTLTLRQHFHGKRWWVLGALFLTPALLAGVVRLTATDVPPVGLEFLFVFMFIPQALLPLLALLYASGIIRDEQEEQTFTYILVRPIPKWAVYGTKVLATLTTTVVLSTVFTALTYLVIYLGTDAGWQDISLRCLKAAGVHALAVAAYCCLFALMSLLTRWTLILGFLYTAIFEGLLANLPFGIRLLTVIYYTRLIAYRSMEFIVTGPRGGKEDMAAITWQLDIRSDPNLAEHPSLTTCLTVLLVASFLCTVLGAFLCSQREFHVKTPEGN